MLPIVTEKEALAAAKMEAAAKRLLIRAEALRNEADCLEREARELSAVAATVGMGS